MDLLRVQAKCSNLIRLIDRVGVQINLGWHLRRTLWCLCVIRLKTKFNFSLSSKGQPKLSLDPNIPSLVKKYVNTHTI